MLWNPLPCLTGRAPRLKTVKPSVHDSRGVVDEARVAACGPVGVRIMCVERVPENGRECERHVDDEHNVEDDAFPRLRLEVLYKCSTQQETCD